ncbi:MAG: hypothetical protein CMC38_03410 [Flavobacteriaceae bacterium]|nr:hypothetical protein [Flavobacteriaceae bacterium]|tara:strand:+ start:700 stop:1140 length:441 start_codon:yes stop_codon:yes gene_type:complete
MDIKLFFSGFFKLYFYWELIVIISIIAVTTNSLIGVFCKRSFQNFDLRITLFSLIFNYIFLIIGVFIFVSNALLLYTDSNNESIIEQSHFLFYIQNHLLNLIAVLILTIGWSLHKRSKISLKKFLRILGFYLFGFIIIAGKFIFIR